MKSYQVWLEGYAATGEHQPAQFVDGVDAVSFVDAVKSALQNKEWDMKYLNIVRDNPVYWGCRFYDNEEEARKAFG
ncbi:hypothetical protein [Acinetobacter sp. ANC 3882]|uniref:hypothetical protein n=1 Tax=Acinetobacter sp. ANC 3882 TaxID=2923423 RepID=UPI001F4B066A|nr:hypothetical protein [Acinetobacter sp. ANC 3882]MCH7312897.1 hypothetical protein [Acinetobacter sp. ANC 3882]